MLHDILFHCAASSNGNALAAHGAGVEHAAAGAGVDFGDFVCKLLDAVGVCAAYIATHTAPGADIVVDGLFIKNRNGVGVVHVRILLSIYNL